MDLRVLLILLCTLFPNVTNGIPGFCDKALQELDNMNNSLTSDFPENSAQNKREFLLRVLTDMQNYVPDVQRSGQNQEIMSIKIESISKEDKLVIYTAQIVGLIEEIRRTKLHLGKDKSTLKQWNELQTCQQTPDLPETGRRVESPRNLRPFSNDQKLHSDHKFKVKENCPVLKLRHSSTGADIRINHSQHNFDNGVELPGLKNTNKQPFVTYPPVHPFLPQISVVKEFEKKIKCNTWSEREIVKPKPSVCECECSASNRKLENRRPAIEVPESGETDLEYNTKSETDSETKNFLIHGMTGTVPKKKIYTGCSLPDQIRISKEDETEEINDQPDSSDDSSTGLAIPQKGKEIEYEELIGRTNNLKVGTERLEAIKSTDDDFILKCENIPNTEKFTSQSIETTECQVDPPEDSYEKKKQNTLKFILKRRKLPQMQIPRFPSSNFGMVNNILSAVYNNETSVVENTESPTRNNVGTGLQGWRHAASGKFENSHKQSKMEKCSHTTEQTDRKQSTGIVCKLCREYSSDIAFVPCGHACCSLCYDMSKFVLCPYCKKEITMTLQLNL